MMRFGSIFALFSRNDTTKERLITVLEDCEKLVSRERRNK